MKKLTRMKLINWHRFENCTIDFGDSTLLSGENGAGKSTLLDAIQFVVTCSASAFNKAAHENGKRKLTGYIRCKTGRENRPYERTGEVSAHVALEFYEESRKKYFIIGAVVDSAAEGQEVTCRYLIDGQKLSDGMFFKGNSPRSIAEFRAANQSIKQWCKTQTDAKKMVRARLGRIEDKFFSLIPKALAFKPIDDIKDFVYSYVLDEKEVNIDVLRENVRSYQDLGRTLESVKKRMEKLEQIEKYHTAAAECIKKDEMYQFFLAQAETDITKERIKWLESEIQREEFHKKEAEQNLAEADSERKQKQEMETNLRVELKQNRDFVALEEQEKMLERLKAEEGAALEEKQELKRSAAKSLESADRLLKLASGTGGKGAGADECVSSYCELFRKVDEITDVAEAKARTEAFIRYKREMYDRVQRKLAEVQIRMNELKEKCRELDHKIENLERKKLSYPEEVERLAGAIREEFRRIGRKAEPCILCEALEIEDEAWRNAVEGYLNTQRFYVLVEPGSFDIALGIYDRLRKEKKAYGAGLVNTQSLDKYDTAPAGTLASAVSSKNKYARRFANLILGKVTMCERYDELKKYTVSITKECMKYQNRVASAIRPEVFKVPFIGKNAFKVQLKQAKEERKQLEESRRETEEQFKKLKAVLTSLSTEHETDVKYRLDVLGKLMRLENAISVCQANIKTLRKNATIIEKQIQLEALKKLREELERKCSSLNQELGMLLRRTEEKKERIRAERESLADQQTALAELTEKAGEELPLWIREYERQTSSKTYERFRDNFDRQRKANETRQQKAEDSMTALMIQYKTEYGFGAAPNMQGFAEFAAVYDRLRTSELLDYEEKVEAARQAAEQEFREQFLAKLQENMKQAQNEFKELNRALKDITFSSEQYEFLYMPAKKYRNYYEMIMDDFNMMQGESIFSGIFHETHKEAIEELFDRLAVNNDNNAKTLDEFTDYRTYMDYDIKIVHGDGTFSYYSKVCEEKSGGETQTPFYVTVAASFVQLYSNNIGGEAARLVMFDEAFNNMDDERIGGVLEFLRRLPLQIIIAAPPDKIQYIGPSMSETLLVMTDERVSFVEEYRNRI